MMSTSTPINPQRGEVWLVDFDSYRCQDCCHEEEVEDIVVDGFAGMSGLKSGQMPRLVCPQCSGSLRAVVV